MGIRTKVRFTNLEVRFFPLLCCQRMSANPNAFNFYLLQTPTLSLKCTTRSCTRICTCSWAAVAQEFWQLVAGSIPAPPPPAKCGGVPEQDTT